MRKLLTILGLMLAAAPAFAITKTPHLVAYFPLMGDALDHSGAGITTTVSGAVPAAGKIGGAYDFNGSSDIRFSLPTAPFNGAGQITIACWTYNRAASYPTGFAAMLRSSSANSNWLTFRTGDLVAFSAETTAGGVIATSAAAAPAGWNFVVGTADATTVRVYLNGTLAGTAGYVGSLNFTTTAWSIGNLYTTSTFNGLIQHVAIYNVALSQPDIKRLMLGLSPLNG